MSAEQNRALLMHGRTHRVSRSFTPAKKPPGVQERASAVLHPSSAHFSSEVALGRVVSWHRLMRIINYIPFASFYSQHGCAGAGPRVPLELFSAGSGPAMDSACCGGIYHHYCEVTWTGVWQEQRLLSSFPDVHMPDESVSIYLCNLLPPSPQ